MTEKYCSAVDAGLFVGVDGEVKLCCSGYGGLGNIRSQSIADIFKSSTFLRIQNRLDNNKPDPYCGICNHVESTAPGSSQRSAFNNQFPITNGRRLKLIDIRWSNVCNLTCRYCNIHDSSEWRKIHNLSVENVDKDYTESLFQEVIDNQNSIENVYLLGGEPLLQKHNSRLLSILKPNVKIDLLTNLAVKLDHNKIYKELQNFDMVLWNLSFDNIGDRFEYVRAGAEWSQFEYNLKKICNDFGAHRVTFHPVYTIWNATRLEEYYEYAVKHDFRIQWQVALQKSDKYGYDTDSFIVFGHNTKIIEMAIKEIDRLKLEDDTLSGIKNSLIKSIEKPNKSKEFISWTERMEHLIPPRKSFNILWPELNTILSEI